MKVSDSGRSDDRQEAGSRKQETGGISHEPLIRHSRFGLPRPIVALASFYVVVHLAFLAPSLEDIDSINFALGLRHFDVANHQPHPPGYPVYIALGRTALTAIRAVAPSRDAAQNEATALAIWSALGSAVALLAAWSIFAAVDSSRAASTSTWWRQPATWGTMLLGASPLFWVTGLRPLSDMTGLAMAMVAQAFALWACRNRSALIAAALLAGIAAGIRVQTACLTMPVLLYAAWSQRSAGARWLASRPLTALAGGLLLWAVPLISSTGGVDGYLRALGTQAGEDFAWTGMLWMNPTPRRLAFALWETFVLPWDNVVLATVVLVMAAVGAVMAVRRDRRALALIAITFGPYVIFHLVLQETAHVRYALPTLPLVAWLVITSAAAAPFLVAPLVAFALVIGGLSGAAYARQPHPAFQAIAAMRARAAETAPAAIYSHFSLRRPLQASRPEHVRIIEPRRSFEWLGLVDYWRGGGTAPVWFLADARRTDLALIDPQSRTNVTRFRWGVADRSTLSGARPAGVDWYVFDRPGWFAAEGWALTPEVGGLSRAAGTGVDRRSIEAYVRRRPGPLRVMVGGRHFSAAGDPAAVFTLSIDGVPIETWNVDVAAGGISFLRFIDLPGGLPPGNGEYARLTIAARAEPASRPTPQVAIRQFDIQSSDTLVYGFGEGWHEEEYETATGLRWRWTSKRSVIRIAPPQAVELMFRGDSPMKYFDAPPRIRVAAGDQVIGELRPDRAFTWKGTVSGDAMQRAGGAVSIEIDRVYLPGAVEGTEDSRQLGLRLFETTVNPGKP
jgi:hypothetical protein